MRSHALRAAFPAALLALLLAGCSGSDPSGPTLAQNPAPDFMLQDVNPSSPTGGRTVLVRDYLGSVSAWYFAHAT